MSSSNKKASHTKGLSKYGYRISDDSEKRRNALRKAVVIFGPSKLLKALSLIRKEHKSSELTIKACRDKKWIKDNYKRDASTHKIRSKSKRKKSRRSKRGKRSKK